MNQDLGTYIFVMYLDEENILLTQCILKNSRKREYTEIGSVCTTVSVPRMR